MLNNGETCRVGAFYGLLSPGTAFNGGGKADMKCKPDGLSPVLLIKSFRTVHKSRPLSTTLSIWIVIVIVCLQILM